MSRARLDWNGEHVREEIRDAAVRGLRLGAEHVLGVSNAHTPIDDGALIRSGVVDVDPSSMDASISYNTPYSAYQHERMDLTHDPGRSAKFLENALTTEGDTAMEIIAAQIRRSLRG